MKNLLSLSVITIAVLLSNCSKSSTGGSETPAVKPSNIVVTADVVGTTATNPNGDGSGVVNFTITGTNVTNYVVSINNQNFNTTTGSVSYTFTNPGTNFYTIYVTAYNGAQYTNVNYTVSVFVTTALLWQDNFDVDGAPDSAKWGYDIGNGSGGWGNNEVQYYTSRSQNVIIQGGILKIITIKEPYLGFAYTSARILTRGKYSVKYGKVEFRAKLPAGGGTWPALWMLGDNLTTGVSWPACGEIDVMEHIGNQLGKIHGTLHHPGHSGGNGDGATTNIANVTTDFHIYSIDWRADAIKFYVDNNLFYTFANNSTLPFNQNFFIIINNAMGGNFGNVGGGIDPNFTTSTFEIDYVRVYN